MSLRVPLPSRGSFSEVELDDDDEVHIPMQRTGTFVGAARPYEWWKSMREKNKTNDNDKIQELLEESEQYDGSDSKSMQLWRESMALQTRAMREHRQATLRRRVPAPTKPPQTIVEPPSATVQDLEQLDSITLAGATPCNSGMLAMPNHRKSRLKPKSVAASVLPSRPNGVLIQRLDALVNSSSFTLLSTVATVWALIGFELMIIADAPRSTDIPLAVVMLCVIALFLFELIALSLVQTSTYFLGFFFWMDVIAVVSLLPETAFLLGASVPALSTFTVTRIGRVARATVRTARFARIFKLFGIRKRRRRWYESERLAWMDARTVRLHDDLDELTEEITEPSVVGEHLSDQIFMNVFLLAIALYIVVSLLQLGTFAEPLLTHAEVALRQLDLAYSFSPAGQTVEYVALRDIFLHGNDNLFFLQLSGAVVLNNARTAESLSSIEQLVVSCGPGCEARFDMLYYRQIDAALSIGLTTLIVVALILSQIHLSSRLQRLFIRPVERMVGKIKMLALNPLAPIAVEDDYEFETGMIESVLSKMGVLMQIGFGAAGSSLISYNLSSSGELVPMVPGTKVNAVFGFCDIRNFTTATEKLQEDVMVFVNHIAEIVHLHTATHGGFPNKNIGDAFLLVWPLSNKPMTPTERHEHNVAAATNAVRAVLAINEALKQSEELAPFTSAICATTKRVRMGFGLHMGWAISGAIGSRMKVDASYLSPHVNISSRLEAATKQYHVSTLISEQVYNFLEDDVKKRCVPVDRVSVLGSAEPLTLYTVIKHPPCDTVRSSLDIGFRTYVKGVWDVAFLHLEEVVARTNDKYPPAGILLAYIKKHGSVAPPDWKGYRRLTCK